MSISGISSGFADLSLRCPRLAGLTSPGAMAQLLGGTCAASSGVDSSRVTTVTANGAGGAGIAALKDPKNILSKRSVLFDYDSYVIKDQYRPLVEAHAKFLVANPTMKMLIQGNTDERGSREYNLALGQKRADAVKKALGLLGVAEGQLESVSLGEEKPSCSDASESCWAANRRGDMLYSGEF